MLSPKTEYPLDPQAFPVIDRVRYDNGWTVDVWRDYNGGAKGDYLEGVFLKTVECAPNGCGKYARPRGLRMSYLDDDIIVTDGATNPDDEGRVFRTGVVIPKPPR